MQNQEMQFADPEWRRPQQTNSGTSQQESFNPQPFNTDPREQLQEERVYNEAGSYGDFGAQKIGAPQSRQRQNRRRSPWLWVIVLLVIMALLGGGLSLPRGGYNFSKVEPAHTFSVGALPTVVINDDVGTIHVHTGSANNNVVVQVTEITGQMSLSSNTGSIHAVQDSLTGQSILHTDTGSVTFEGTIDPKGSYQFETNTGSVDVTLPGNSSFHLDASTDTGSINSDFPGVNVQHGDFTGASAHSDVGNAPGATVTLKADTGSISLHQGP